MISRPLSFKGVALGLVCSRGSQVARREPDGFSWFVSAFLVLVTAAIIIREQPYFGNMDDGTFLSKAAGASPLAFVGSWDHVEFGNLRHASFLGTWPLYRFANDPLTLFLANAVLVVFCLLVFWWVLRPLMGDASSGALGLFLAVAILWPFTSDLFFFPSLQEKFVILGAAGLLGWVHLARRNPQSVYTWMVLVVLVPVAFTTKLHIVVFVPGVLLALWVGRSSSPRPGLRAAQAVASLVMVGASAALGVLALVGDYTSERRGGAFDLTRLSEWRFIFLAAVTVAVALACACFRWAAPARPGTEAQIVCLTSLVTMVGAFLVWDVYQRHLAIASVMIAGSAVSFAAVLGPRARFAVACTTLVLASAWQMYRLPHVFSSLGSFGDFIRSEQADNLAEQEAVVYSTCFEARYNYELYALREGVPGLRFGWLDDSEDPNLLSIGESGEVLVLADHVLCPLSQSSWSKEVRDVAVVWESDRGRGFQLLAMTP